MPDDAHATPPDSPGDPPLADRINSRDDIPELRSLLKDRARDARADGEDVGVEDFLAMSRNNDAAYVQPSDIEKAEWFADIWQQEGEPELAPRSFHYQIAGAGYELRDGTPYENTTKCWNELKDAAKWAQILGLVDADAILDNNSRAPTATGINDLADPQPPGDVTVASAAGTLDVTVDDGYRTPRIGVTIKPPRICYDDARDLTETQADRLVDRAFNSVSYHVTSHQDYYIELWAEKGGVLDDDLASDYDATIREAGGGEFSYEMCRDAVRVAEERDQGLVVAIVSDFDPKGADMGRSAARKIELEAALADTEAHVHHAALTKDQLLENPTPATPAKEPRGLMDQNPGALAYERQKDYFEEYAQGDAVEVNSYLARHPDAYEASIRDVLDPYYDHDLADRLQAAVDEAREETRDRLLAAFEAVESDVASALDDLDDAFDEYEARLSPEIHDVRDAIETLQHEEQLVRRELHIEEKRDALRELVDGVEYESVLAEADISVPTPRVAPSEDALLDTRRGFFEQLEKYKEEDIRYADSEE